MKVKTICENSLFPYLGAVNAALGTTLSFPPMFGSRSVKTEGLQAMTTPANVKTAARLTALYNLILIHRGDLRAIAISYRGWLRGTTHIYSLDGEVLR